MSDAVLGWGAKLRLNGTEIAEVVSIKPPAVNNDKVEVTHLQSPSRRREFIAGLIDSGEMTFGINWIPDNTTQIALITLAQAGTDGAWEIELPDGGATVIGFDGSLNFEPGELTPDGKMSATCTIIINSDVDYDA